ncbi:MAG: MFS transporter [Actinomycetales bacterium]|nr:MFS transporter [Actinomycetales bacterium]
MSATVIVSIPTLLLAAVYPALDDELGFGGTTLGSAVGAYWATAAVGSAVVARVGSRAGASLLLVAAFALAAVSTAGVAVWTPTPSALVAWIALGGVASACAHPAANHVLAGVISGRRASAAFGLKQASVPIAGLLAGVSVPLIVAVFGWRAAFASAAFVAAGLLLVTLLARRSGGRAESRPIRRDRNPHRRLIALSAVGGLASGAATASATFFVVAAVDRGVAAADAALLLATAGALSAGTRIAVGWLAAGRAGAALRWLSLLVALATIGATLLATGTGGWFVVGFLAVVGVGWGWPGLLHYVARLAPDPRSATGLVLLGTYSGNAAGPLLFGVVSTTVGIATAWWVNAAALGVSSVIAGATAWANRRTG